MEKKIAEDCRRKKLPLPKDVENAPVLNEGLELFYSAFAELSTCRSFGMSVGPIPWTAIKQYSDYYEFDADLFDDLVYYIGAMDKTYIEYCDAKQQPKKSIKKT